VIDQHGLWNSKHAAGEHNAYGFDPRGLAAFAKQYIPTQGNLLELGCGIGADAHFFAAQGYKVTASDFSEVVIEANRTRWKDTPITFEVVDVTHPLPYRNGAYQIVYASLSLHYFDDHTTKQIFSEIARVLGKDGVLVFSCKSTADPKYGLGTQIGPDIFERKGHIRHFFSKHYCEELLRGSFEVLEVSTDPYGYIGEKSAFVYAAARKLDTRR
jgi:ubiquinone/menaquinone biosynthesis C-methylase UbiE